MADTVANDPRFEWIPFYREYAEKLYYTKEEINCKILCELLELNEHKEMAEDIYTDPDLYNPLMSLTFLSMSKDQSTKHKSFDYIRDSYRIGSKTPDNLKGVPFIGRFDSFYPLDNRNAKV